MKRFLITSALLPVLSFGALATTLKAQQTEVPTVKQTSVGLYMTAKEAYETGKANRRAGRHDPGNLPVRQPKRTGGRTASQSRVQERVPSRRRRGR